MGSLSFLVIVFVISMLWVSFITNRMPKTGREGISKGKEVSAVITNNNRGADRAVVMRAVGDDGRKYKVKMSPTEAHLWKKGDRVTVLISEEDGKKYRIMFNDYFRNNEDRLRVYAKELLEKKIRMNFIATRFVKYTKESGEAFKNSKLNSQRIFTFITLMSMIDGYTVFTGVCTIAFLVYFKKCSLKFSAALVPAAIIALMAWYISSAVKTCVKIKTEAEKSI